MGEGRQTAAEEAEVAGTGEGGKGDRARKGWGNVRGFRTANYVNCRCCKLPSQFAFILHTIHTVSAHLAWNPSTWILLLPPARRRERGERRRRRGGEGRWRRLERDGSSPPRTERETLVRCLLLTSHSSSLVLDDARVPVSANRYRCRTAPSEGSRTFSSWVSHYRERETQTV